MSPLPVRSTLRSAYAFALDRAAWRATLRIAWPALLLYFALSLWEAANPPPADAAPGSLAALPLSGLALAGLTAAGMRVRAFGPAARLSIGRWLSLSLWVLVWSALLGAGLALVGLAALGIVVGLIAALPEAARAAFLVPFQASPMLAAAFALVLAATIGFGLLLAFLRLYLIVPAAAADRAVSLAGAWALARGQTGRLVVLVLASVIAADLAANALAEGAAALTPDEATGFAVSTLAYNALALLANQVAAGAWSGAVSALDGDAADGEGTTTNGA